MHAAMCNRNGNQKNILTHKLMTLGHRMLAPGHIMMMLGHNIMLTLGHRILRFRQIKRRISAKRKQYNGVSRACIEVVATQLMALQWSKIVFGTHHFYSASHNVGDTSKDKMERLHYATK